MEEVGNTERSNKEDKPTLYGGTLDYDLEQENNYQKFFG